MTRETSIGADGQSTLGDDGALRIPGGSLLLGSVGLRVDVSI